jgi:hypothetical protein
MLRLVPFEPATEHPSARSLSKMKGLWTETLSGYASQNNRSCPVDKRLERNPCNSRLYGITGSMSKLTTSQAKGLPRGI